MTDRYAVIGKPIAHSKSPGIHTAFAEQTGQRIEYVRIEGEPGRFAAQVDALRAEGGRGLNITAPFKLDACAYATELRDRARHAGAANALLFDGDRVVADNFDGIGVVADVQRNLGCPIRGRRVLLLGAGGAARGAIPALLDEHPAELGVANRTPAKAEALRDLFAAHGGLTATGYDALGTEDAKGFDLVINATSAGLHGEGIAIRAAVFAPDCLAYDMTYGKGLTGFLRLAQEAGVTRLADGVGMLVEQAAPTLRPSSGP